MYLRFLANEVKKVMRDAMLRFMLAYPLILGAIGRYALPWAQDVGVLDLATQADLPLAMLLLMNVQVFGAVIGFSILDDRDDGVLASIRVSPLTVTGFLSFRLVLLFVAAFLGGIFILWFSAVGGLGVGDVFALSLLTALGAPMMGLFINALAGNKIEGFATMKGLGILLVFPIVSMFFSDAKELLFAFAPGFWPAKILSVVVRGEAAALLGYCSYFWLGLVYMMALNRVAYHAFSRRLEG